MAVKTLKETGNELQKDFEREAELLSSFDHPNIVSFYGISTDSFDYMMIFEFMNLGDLNNFLRFDFSFMTTTPC